jgi:hypothetical protein
MRMKCGLQEGWNGTYIIQGRFCKIPRYVAKMVEKSELGTDRRRCKILCKNWVRILQMDKE